MYRNKALTVLQKTYDDSYLSCSTAVYYEGQGDEPEAMRHWRSALEQIYEHNAIRLPSTYVAQSESEKALQDALKQLELQCKERLDLLEALRASRQEPPTTPQPNKISKVFSSYQTSHTDHSGSSSRAAGSIGQGTIPAVSYSDLSRPAVPKRPSLPNRPSTEVLRGPSPGPNPFDFLTPSSSVEPMNSPPAASRSYSPAVPPRPERKERSTSPEKRTMRTTLRSGKPGEKAKPRKPVKPAAEGPSKAATKAWSALGSRDKVLKSPSAEALAAVTTHSRPNLESSRKASIQAMQWDSHSRRLVREAELGNGASGPGRHSDEYSSRPSFLSVSAASNALSNSAPQDPALADASINRATNSVSSPPKPQRQNSLRDGKTSDSSAETQDKTKLHGVPLRRKPITRPAPPKPAPAEKEIANHSRRRDRPPPRQKFDSTSSEDDPGIDRGRRKGNGRKEGVLETVSTDDTRDGSPDESSAEDMVWKKKKTAILKNLPPGVDESAAKQILNDIVVQGDEVRWGDIAGLEIAKNALRETVVYPFLRPDLFSGLREPARGMLLFGPPGTGKTMLARAVATESLSTFFSISASSLTSKFLGESEKLVRALFGLARTLAPSIIFVDEIDSLLSQRSGSGEHEATRRIKTEFLIQWSDLQRAAAGREVSDRDKERGDANRVLVLAATNLPWAIDEAARRRFVRRQYIPLPEEQTREVQLRTLLGQQKHSLSSGDIQRLVHLTDGFSGSDITALAKDAAMGPLRSLGEALLSMTMDQIRPIALVDFEASLGTIRPSVSKAGLKEYEDWAKEFGERGG